VYPGFGSSELPVRKLVLQLDVSEIKRKLLRSQDTTLHFGFHLLQFNILSGLDLWRPG
jgi:hypothetical protein